MKNFFLTLSFLSLVCLTSVGQISLDSTATIASINEDANFTVSGLNNDKIIINVYDRWGSTVMKKEDMNSISGSHSFKLQLHEFPKTGIYVYRIEAGDSTFTGTITVLYPEKYTIETEGTIISDSSYLSINISHLQLDTISVIIYNVVGEAVITKIKEELRYGSLQYVIENNDFAEDGTYLLSIAINDSSYVKKLVVSNTILSNTNTIGESKLNIFPNPFSYDIDLSCLSNTTTLQLTDEFGRTLWYGNDNDELADFMKGLSAGKYVLRAQGNKEPNQYFTQSIIKL